MNVLVTGAYGRCGTAIIDHLHDREEYEFTYFNRSDRGPNHEYGGYDTVVGNITDYEAVRDATEGHDAVIHLAGFPYVSGSFEDVLEPNILGTFNVLRAAQEVEVDSVVFASTNHVVGGYESEFAPELYDSESTLLIDHTDPVRPDSFYAVSKLYGENLGRYFVENYEHPSQFYALRICSTRHAEYDHPYGDAEQGVDDDKWERGSDEYENEVARMKATWCSRRDFSSLVECCLIDDTVDFDVFYGVSGNRHRWFDLEHARSVVGYVPRDDGSDWDSPPK